MPPPPCRLQGNFRPLRRSNTLQGTFYQLSVLLGVYQCLSVSLCVSSLYLSVCLLFLLTRKRIFSPSPNFLPFRYSLEQWSPDGNWSADKYDRIFFDAEISPLGQHCTGALMRIHHIFMIYLAG